MPEADRPASPPATLRSSYPIWTEEKIRYGDTDRQGHVNNAVFATFCESGRVAFFHEQASHVSAHRANFAIVRLELDFRAELFYPGTVDIGTRVLSLGRSSFHLGQGIFAGDLCAATAHCIMVLMDDTTRKSTPLTPELRAWLEARLVP